MSSALERQTKPIYDALDSGSNKSALVICNKFLKKTPNNALVKALKALALVRMQKVEESLHLCDEILAGKPTDDGTLTAMMHVLRALGRNQDTVKMFEDAHRQQPTNEDLACQTFLANCRVSNWKAAQQVASKLQKQFQDDRYVCWNAMSSLLQARDPSTPAAMRPILLKLSHRLLTSHPPQIILTTADRFFLYLTVLIELELWDDADVLVNDNIGTMVCSTSLACNELRRQMIQKRGLWEQEGKRARELIQEKKDRNWLEFLSVLDATFSPVAHPQNETVQSEGREKCAIAVEDARALFTEVAERDGNADRSGLLAQLELEKRCRKYNLDTTPSQLLKLMQDYFRRVGGKACCFEDLKPYLDLPGDELTSWLSFLGSAEVPVESLATLQRHINIKKLQRFHLKEEDLTLELETQRAREYTMAYFDGLPYGVELPSTETQPADDLAILAVHAYVNMHIISGKQDPLFSAVSLLEHGLTKSKHGFQLRLILIRLYHILCAPSLALEHYRALGIKQVQNDTLSYLLLSRASAFSLGATGDLTLMSESIEAAQIYVSNAQDTPDALTRALIGEKYSQISDFLTFFDRLEHSIQRDLSKIELIRMRLAHEAITTDFIDVELIELKFNFDRFHSDNRDFDIVPNYQPSHQATFFKQTELFHEPQNMGWLWVFLKIYIRALQHGSDLDDVVEEKLLIGDRPKLSNDPENLKPLKQRLLERVEEERKELSNAESSFYDFCTAIADWLEPHHDHTRPLPAQVLAKASKLTEQKTGHPLKGYSPSSGDTVNNSHRREEDAPTVQEAPGSVFDFFDAMHTSFKDAVSRKAATEALHIATITQESLCLLAVESLRFKSSSLVKMHKLGNLVQSIKDIRSTAVEVLNIMSSELIAWGDREAIQDQRKTITDAALVYLKDTPIDHDSVLTIAKKVTDARKKVLDGVGQGIAKICKTHGL